MAWQFNNTEPIYLQIVEKIKLDIITGKNLPNDQLPTVRQLADTISVNPNTVQRAMLELEKEGLVYTQGTVGRFIVHDQNLPLRLKKELASRHLESFLFTMSTIGYSKPDIVSLIENQGSEG